MTHAAADALSLVLADIPRALVPPAALSDAAKLVASLPPVVRCGFEVRLGQGGEVDLQQGIVADPLEHRTVLEHLRRAGAEGAARDGLAALVERWQNPGSELHDGVEDVWLEFDDRRGDALSVFVGFARTPAMVASRLRLASLAAESLGRDLGPAVRRCFDACPRGAFVSHLGMMLGRPAPFWRVNVRRVEPADLAAYLAGVGWDGEAADATALATELRELVDGVTLCLDVGTGVHRRLGFEAHGVRGAPEPRWGALLDVLVARGWCTAAKREALLAWPGLVTPVAGGPWPAGLARDALLRPADHFTAIARVVSHVKLVVAPGEPVQAKGYIGFEHRWLRPPTQRDPPGRPGTTKLRGAAGAVAFLLAARTRSGWWRDFAGTLGADDGWGAAMGPSDEYVSAYVAAALAAVGGSPARDAAGRGGRCPRERLPSVLGRCSRAGARRSPDGAGAGACPWTPTAPPGACALPARWAPAARRSRRRPAVRWMHTGCPTAGSAATGQPRGRARTPRTSRRRTSPTPAGRRRATPA